MTIDTQTLQQLEKDYTIDKVNQIINVTDAMNMKIADEAREILRNKHKNKGDLINSIKTTVNSKNNVITGQVSSAKDYARFVHEGVDHKGTSEVHPMLVRFRVAPSLLSWAKSKGVVYQKRNDGTKRKTNTANGAWYMTSKKTGKEYRVDVANGGLMVKIEPSKFLEIPFKKYEKKYIQEIERIFSK